MDTSITSRLAAPQRHVLMPARSASACRDVRMPHVRSPCVYPERHPDASLDAPTESVCPRLDEGELLAPGDAQQIQAALGLSEPKRKAPAGRWSLSFAAAVLCHVLAIAAMAILCAQRAPTAPWRVVRGDPGAQDGSPKSYVPTDDAIAEEPSIAAVPHSLPATDSRASAMDQSLEDSSSLPDHLESLKASPADTVIGIGVSANVEGASQRLPHFTSPKAHIATSSSKTAATQPVGQLADGETTPPRVAGPRGQRDGFDSRGLPIPDYPSESLRRGEQGMVVVDVEVLPDGSAGVVRIASDAGYPRLGKAAAERVKLATFEPARADGRPVVGHIRIPYRFMLQ